MEIAPKTPTHRWRHGLDSQILTRHINVRKVIAGGYERAIKNFFSLETVSYDDGLNGSGVAGHNRISSYSQSLSIYEGWIMLWHHHRFRTTKKMPEKHRMRDVQSLAK